MMTRTAPQHRPTAAAGCLPCSPGFASTTLGLPNREADRQAVEAQLQLPEDGAGAAAAGLLLVDRKGYTLGRGYRRIVYGDHGPYVELAPEQLPSAAERVADGWREDGAGPYYVTHFSPASAKLYEQTRDVSNKPNPPRSGGRGVWNNRPEGYADYQPGYWYVSCEQVVVVEPDAGPDQQATVTPGTSFDKFDHRHWHNSAAAAVGATATGAAPQQRAHSVPGIAPQLSKTQAKAGASTPNKLASTELVGMAVGYRGALYSGAGRHYDSAWTSDCEARESYGPASVEGRLWAALDAVRLADGLERQTQAEPEQQQQQQQLLCYATAGRPPVYSRAARTGAPRCS
jgi:hypothetical protein